MRFPFLDHPGPLAFAHRGGAGDWPENTMPAFEGAVALGYRYLETDVHVTADGEVLAFHDESLDRVTDATGLIRDHTWNDLQHVRVAGREPIPRLVDLLGAWDDVCLNIDPKHDSVVAALADVLRRTDALDRVCIGSFSDQRIATLRGRLGPRLATSLGPRSIARLRAASFGVPAGRFHGACVQVPPGRKGVRLVDERFVAAAHGRGLQVHVWTIDEPDVMHDLFDLGVDGIMTDRPAVLRDVLEARGCWYGRDATSD